MPRWTVTLILTIMLTSTVTYGQPSSSIYFVFRLYSNGQVIERNKFCNEWKISNCNAITPCDEFVVGSLYDTSSKYYYLDIGALHRPYIFTLIHLKDTMTIIFPTTSYLVCDSLTINNGTFLFDYSCSDQDKIKLNRISGVSFCRLNNINWVLQRKKYEQSIYYKRK